MQPVKSVNSFSYISKTREGISNGDGINKVVLNINGVIRFGFQNSNDSLPMSIRNMLKPYDTLPLDVQSGFLSVYFRFHVTAQL